MAGEEVTHKFFKEVAVSGTAAFTDADHFFQFLTQADDPPTPFDTDPFQSMGVMIVVDTGGASVIEFSFNSIKGEGDVDGVIKAGETVFFDWRRETEIAFRIRSGPPTGLRFWAW